MRLFASDVRLQDSNSVFVTETASFLITDDLQIMPTLVLNLLRWSLLSKTPLTDLVLLGPSSCNIVKSDTGGQCSLWSINNLYKSIRSLDAERHIKSRDLKDMVLEPMLAQNFLCKNQILPIREVEAPPLYWVIGSCPYLSDKPIGLGCSQVTCIDPKNPTGGTTVVGGFIKGPATFMVTDDLTVTLFSSLSIISALKRLNIPLGDVEEREVSIGMEENKQIGTGYGENKEEEYDLAVCTFGTAIDHLEVWCRSCHQWAGGGAGLCMAGGEDLTLKILVDKAQNKVLFAEAGEEFVDILLSFLTLPLGTIVRLLSMPSDSSQLKFGCLTTLYQSVSALQTEHFWTKVGKDMLLNPRNSAAAQCQKLKIDIDDTARTKYFMCPDRLYSNRRLLSTFADVKCTCGKLMDIQMELAASDVRLEESTSGVFVTEKASFIITDDLQIMPNLLGTTVALLSTHGKTDMNVLEERTLKVAVEEVLNLLRGSLLSKMPLTDLVRQGPFSLGIVKSYTGKYLPPTTDSINTNCRRMTVKVLVQKSTKKALHAQVEEDFVDFLFSFLTIPLGSVVSLLGGECSLRGINNLYNSIRSLDAERHVKSQDLKDMLLEPMLAQKFLCKNQILPIREVEAPPLCCVGGARHIYRTDRNSDFPCSSVTCIDPKNPTGGTTVVGGFIKGPATFMVTDDLTVTPFSSLSIISALKRLNIPLGDVEEREVSIGMEEALGLLKASLESTSALTDGLSLMLQKPKQEKNP
ncbi:hypothetical protein RJ640_014274 [Escallonia rubra]|uniref:DUF674 family protein n=1 Tax=Escallonia rubra TaxID=112253 RepID=A0AA88QXH2_9ASTE|nr:hypothetical protein RJ640_014274 [Escallonia rubra]